MPRATRAPRSTRSGTEVGERGAGLVSTLAGVTVFLAFLLLAVQVMFNLYATSAVTAAAYDAARVVAGSNGHTAQAAAEARARQVLGRYAERVRFDWTVDGEVVRLRVRARNPSFLLPALGGAVGFDEVDRTVRVRVERLR
jgi:Flp pilus assembly protein TadG